MLVNKKPPPFGEGLNYFNVADSPFEHTTLSLQYLYTSKLYKNQAFFGIRNLIMLHYINSNF